MTTLAPASATTRNIVVRPLAPSDEDDLFAWLEPGEAAVWLESTAGDPGRQGWVVEFDGAPSGLAGLHDIDRGHQRCAWTCHVTSPAPGLDAYIHAWGAAYVFEGLRLAKLWCEAAADDAAAIARLESNGFAIEARLRGHSEHDGHRRDVVRLGLLAADWRAARAVLGAKLTALGFEPPEIG
ncbi:MAG TPA: UDP-4-amino-4,6-dideoxy-N-acetyl-beta-L-altrosamine N-acetyltransferase [Caulobacteraceae bacterium]|nr:UDP-4-amino-4,6-dideoxy-N-acetyl-beta-L-altrosamine N-acetyltransferase [Caulobacteraceae bacterium]